MAFPRSIISNRASLPLELAPYGSSFVVFRQPTADHPPRAPNNATRWILQSELRGPWKVTFDKNWGGPGAVEFADLESWTDSNEPGIEFYSGTAVYKKAFTLPGDLKLLPQGARLWLDLGSVRELAEVKINGQSCGITWSLPFRVDVSDAVNPGVNQLESEVVSFWPNRSIGDDALTQEQRLTRANIRRLTSDTELMKSGLLLIVAQRMSHRHNRFSVGGSELRRWHGFISSARINRIGCSADGGTAKYEPSCQRITYSTHKLSPTPT